MDKELELEAKEQLYCSIIDQVEEISEKEKIAQCKECFFESIDVEVVRDDENKRIAFFWKDKLGKHISIKNIRLNICKLFKGMIELYIESWILDESAIWCIVKTVKMIFEACLIDFTEEEIVIILGIYYEVSIGHQIIDDNLCDSVNLYAEKHMGVKLEAQRIYEIIDHLYKNGIVDINDGNFTIGDKTIVW